MTLSPTQQLDLVADYQNGLKRVAICEKYSLKPPQMYALLRRNGVESNRSPRKSNYHCSVCGIERKLPPYAHNNIWRGTPTCGDPACRSVLFVRPDLWKPATNPYPGGQHPPRRHVLPNEDSYIDPEMLHDVAKLTEDELAALEKAFSFKKNESGADISETAKKALWGRLSRLTVAIRLISDGAGETAIRISRRSPLKDFLRQFFGTEARGRDVAFFDVILLWRCSCLEQTIYVIRSVAEIPVLAGDYGVCPRCSAAALEVA